MCSEFGMPVKVVARTKMCLNETCGKVHVGRNLFDELPVQSGLKQGV
jgi:hypothetical protein